MTPEVQDWESHLRHLEDAINHADGDGLRARWESGRYLLKLREGSQLPRGMGAVVAKDLSIHRSELTARMKFAAKFQTEDQLANAISTYRTWFAIKQQGLTTTHRVQKAKPSALLRVLAVIENLDYGTLIPQDCEVLSKIADAVQRAIDGAVYLQKEVA